jgi:hypothetical protein
MNDKIRQIVWDVGLPTYNPEGIPTKLEKFAEAIIRECADQCDMLLNDKMGSEWTRGTHDCSKAIRKHFGVEE